MPRPVVYLAGAITGCSYEGATSWREHAVKRLDDLGVSGASPLRGKDYLSHLDDIQDDTAAEINDLMSGPRGIMTRDHYDCTRSQVLLANLKGASRVSIGTVMEVAWAWHERIPVVVVRDRGDMHEHAMLNEASDFIVDDLDEAIHLIGLLLAPYT